MTIYRVLIPLATYPPIEAGYIGPLSLGEDKIQRLLEREIIAVVHIPPLGIFPQWEERKNQLEEVGIDPSELFGPNLAALAQRLGVPEEEVLLWREELRRILTI